MHKDRNKGNSKSGNKKLKKGKKSQSVKKMFKRDKLPGFGNHRKAKAFHAHRKAIAFRASRTSRFAQSQILEALWRFLRIETLKRFVPRKPTGLLGFLNLAGSETQKLLGLHIAQHGRQSMKTNALIVLLAIALTTTALFVYADNTECIIGCDSNETCIANCLNTEEYVVIENAGDYCEIICDTNQNCDDGNQNTTDICDNGGTCQSSCINIETQPPCGIICDTNPECNDNDANTAGRCENAGTCGAKCVNTKEEAEAYVVIENASKEAEADVVIENAYLPEGEMEPISARVEIRGLEEPFPEIDSRIDSYTADSPEDGNINTLVAAFDQELEFEEATITLPKTGPVNTIVKCQDFNFEMFECSHWEKTSIPFTETQDTITFAVNTFSAYAGALIKITKAAHLDQNREFISDIYEQVKEKDGVWSETIGVNEWIRISFEQPLGKTNDITVFARSLDGDARIEVYRQNGNELLAEISGINKESWYKTLLNGLDEDEKTAHFDLKVKDSSMQFDYIVDPANLDVNVTRVDGYDVSKAMPSFSYAIDGNLTIDFNVATDTNFGVTWADLNYSATNTQGSGTEIVKGLVVDGNRCQTNFIDDWNNQANSDANLVGYWKFDAQEDVNTLRAFDYSGKGNHGQYMNSADNNATGRWDTNAAWFNGIQSSSTGSCVTIADSSTLEGFTSMTISAWIYQRATQTGDSGTVFTKSVTAVGVGATYPYTIFDFSVNNSNKVSMCVGDGASRVCMSSWDAITNNVWTHIVGTYDNSLASSNIKVYINGLQDGTTGNATLTVGTNAIDVRIGAYMSSNYPNNFIGSIEEVKVYNRALTASEILQGYNRDLRNFRTCSWGWNISGIADANYYANVLARDDASNSKFDPSDNSFHVNPGGAPSTANLDTNVWRIDGWNVNNAMPVFSYSTDGNLTIDFNFASDTNYGYQYADLNYSTSKTQGTGTSIINSLKVDGNRCQTNFLRDWNNFANSDVNLVGYWKFDAQEDVNTIRAFDYSGNGNHGQYLNGADNNAQGKWDTNAGFFDGTNDYVHVSDSSSLDLTNNFAISLWVKPNDLTQTNRYLLSKLGTSDNTYAIIWEYVGDNLEFYSSSYTGSNPRTGSQIPITNTNWHHIVYTYNGSTWAGYRDGENIFSLSTTFSLTASTQNLLWGTFDGVGTCGGTGCSFGGLIEEAKIYNRALTANEISMDYNLGIRNFRTCSYDWNISGIADANYYANVLARDNAGNSDYNSSNNNFRVNPAIVNTPPSLVIWQVDSHDFNATLPSFSYAADGNLTIKFRAADAESSDLNFNMWYDTVSGGKTNKLIGDINLSTETGHGSCDTNSKTGMVCNWDWNIFGISDSNYWIAIELNDGTDTNTMPSAKSFRVNPSTQNLTNLDTNTWRVDKWDTSKTMPAFSYTTDGNLTIDFNFASDTNFGNQYADLYYSTSKTQGTGTLIIDSLKVDGNRCQTNFIDDWNNQANSDVNLVGYWKFDSDNGISAWDFSGKGNTGAYTGGADNNAQGKWDTNAGFFDGIDDYVSVADSASLTFNNATNDLPFSVSMWVNFNAIAGKEIALVGKYLTTGPEWNTQLLDNGKYYMQCLNIAGASTRIKISSSFVANTGIWNHVVFTYDGSSSQNGMNIYLNGVQDPSPTRAMDGTYAKMGNFSTPVDIGATNRDGGIYASYMNGLIEEVKIYDKTLTASEILKDYALSLRNFRTCSYDWNISGIADANYYANVLARDDAGNSDYNSSNNNFRVNPSAPAASPTVGQLRICDGTCALSKTIDPQTAFTVEATISDPNGYSDINTESIKLELYSFYDRNGCTENWDCNRLAMRDDNISLGTRNGCTHSPSTNVYCINVPVSAWSTKFLNGDTNIYVRVDDNDTAGVNTHRMDANWLRDHNAFTVNANLTRSEDTTSGTYSGAPATTYNAFDSGQTVNAYIISTHSGNVTMDVNLTGTDLNISATVFIGDGNETWNIANATAGSTPISPVSTAAVGDWNRGSYPDSNTQNIWYWLSIPNQQQNGSYTGTITYSSGQST